MAFADVSDLEARWRELTDEEQERATVLLDDASAMLSALVEVDDTDEQQAELLKIVTCNMVRRAMSASAVDGITQAAQTIGSTSVSVGFANPDGGFYLTKTDKQMLGISASGRYRSIQAQTIYDECGDSDGTW